jgi:hypothetical protein
MSGATFQALLMIGAPCDPFYSNVVFLSSFEQAQTSGFGLTEQSPLGAIVTFSQPYNNNGPSQSCVSSLNPEYGGASARSDNTTSASLPFNPAYRISPANSSPFTIEYSLYQTDANVVGDNYVAFSTLVASGNYGWMIRHTGGSMDFFWSTDGTNILSISAPGVITTANAWVKYAVTKNASGLIRLFKNGIQVASATPANSAFFASTGGLSMCASAPAQQCYMDNGRITAGVCRYDAASYAVATGPFPTIACYGWASYDGVASNATLSNNNRTVVHTNTIVGGARSTSLKNSGKYYHEITWDASISGQDSGNGLLTAAGTYANLAAGAINGIAVFRGVPYAAAPIGELRFSPPRPTPWVSARRIHWPRSARRGSRAGRGSARSSSRSTVRPRSSRRRRRARSPGTGSG